MKKICDIKSDCSNFLQNIEWKIGFSHASALLFYTHTCTCITLLPVLAEFFAYEAAIVLVFQRSLVLSLDKDNIKSIKMFVGVSTTTQTFMYLHRNMKNQREFVVIKWERKFIQLSNHVYYLIYKKPADTLYGTLILTTLDLLCNSVEYVISNSLF